jgi:H/ACA ribonucleoprotein complex subunit 3
LVWLLRKCVKCDSYTLNQDTCPTCGGPVKMPHPAKFSMDDRYQSYKLRMLRMAKEKQAKAAPEPQA